MDSRVAIDPAICHGQACIKGARIPVHQILPMLACGMDGYQGRSASAVSCSDPGRHLGLLRLRRIAIGLY